MGPGPWYAMYISPFWKLISTKHFTEQWNGKLLCLKSTCRLLGGGRGVASFPGKNRFPMELQNFNVSLFLCSNTVVYDNKDT